MFYWKDAMQFSADAKDVIRQNVVDLICRVPEYIIWQEFGPSPPNKPNLERYRHFECWLAQADRQQHIFRAVRYVECSDEWYLTHRLHAAENSGTHQFAR
jgi:hypothetical protein